MIPCGGGLRILGIHELFVENDPLELIGKLTNLGGIRGRLEAAEQRLKGLVLGVALLQDHCGSR